MCSSAASAPALARLLPLTSLPTLLSAQVEHHLFPAISFVHYPAIAAIVRDECAKRGVQYSQVDAAPCDFPRAGEPHRGQLLA